MAEEGGKKSQFTICLLHDDLPIGGTIAHNLKLAF